MKGEWCRKRNEAEEEGERGKEKEKEDGEEKERLEVAVKALKKGCSVVKFLQEAAIMGQFNHPSIVKLHGVVIDEEPVSSA